MAFAAALLLQLEPAGAATCAYRSVEHLARDIARHFQARTLTDLGRRLPPSRVRLRIEHAIDEKLNLTDRLAITGLDARLAAAEKAEPRRASAGRLVLDGMACQGLTCRFGPSGILHNNLYLQQIRLSRSRGCLTLVEIHLLDGD